MKSSISACLVLILVAALAATVTWFVTKPLRGEIEAWSNWDTPNLGGPEFGQSQIVIPDGWKPQEEK